jgi:hypothetical protein
MEGSWNAGPALSASIVFFDAAVEFGDIMARRSKMSDAPANFGHLDMK